MNNRVRCDICLNCYCPRCDNFVNIFEYDEFLCYYRFIDPRDRSIDLTKDIMVECSECGYEFDVYFEGDNQTDINSRIHQYIEELKTSEKHRIRDRCRFRRRNDETVLTRDDD